MASTMERKLGEMLVKDDVITHEELEAAFDRQESSRQSLGRILEEMGLASDFDIAATLGKQLNVPFMTLAHYELDRGVLDTIPSHIARKYKIIPVDKTGDTLTVALSDPSNVYLMDELSLLTGNQIIPVISFESEIEEALDKYYSGEEASSNFDEMLQEITDEDIQKVHAQLEEEADGLDLLEGGEERDELDKDDGSDVNDAPVISLVNEMVIKAIMSGASDIHVEPFEKKLRIRYRIDGVLHEQQSPPKRFQNAIVSRIKILSELDIAEKRLPQDGRFRIRKSGRNIDFRVSTCPMIHGEKVVIRILDQGNLMLDLGDLGFDPEELGKLEGAIHQPWGMLLITGPTGSGKSTTLYSALSTINDPHKNINTIEDPVEYNLVGINQVASRPDIGLTFAEGLKSFLRQDPDIIMIGEVRDLETAEIAIKAALTGHLVLSTIHTNDSSSTPQRLTNMGVEPFLVSASLLMVEAQRLVRRVCRNCRREYTPDREFLAGLGVRELDEARLYRGVGCDTCNGIGTKGRVGLYEIMSVDEEIRDAITNAMPVNQLKKLAIKHGMRTLRMAGVRKALQGVAPIEEVLSSTMADDPVDLELALKSDMADEAELD